MFTDSRLSSLKDVGFLEPVDASCLEYRGGRRHVVQSSYTVNGNTHPPLCLVISHAVMWQSG